MENNENFVTEQVTEVVEQPTEQAPKMFTQEEVNEIVGKAKARSRAKVEREFQKKYGDLGEVLKAGTGKKSVEELKETFTDFYKDKGVKLPEKPRYSDKEISILAKVDADEIIGSGFDEVVEEVERLAALGVENMSSREKETFRHLATYRQKHERSNEFTKLGITEDVYNSDAFQKIVGMSSSKASAQDIVDVYRSTIPKKNIKPAGSMVSEEPQDNGVKDFYTFEEARKFTKADFDKNPAIYKKVQESMTKW